MTTPTTLEKTLPRHCYMDPSFFDRECKAIFASEWFCVARAPEFEKIGEYRVVNVAGESVIVLKNADTEFRAFHNMCRHRGSQLVPHADCGTLAGCFSAGIRCPYHSWQYALDGRLRNTPHVKVNKDELGLHEVALEAWGGFLFVQLAQKSKGQSLNSSLCETVNRVQRYPLAELRVGKRINYSVRANWKVLLENYNECYHCAGVHPELCTIVPVFRKKGGSGLDWNRGIPHREGANTFTFSGTTIRKPFPGLNSDEKNRHKGELIYPNLLLSLGMDHVAAFTLLPRTHDLTDVVCEFLFHPKEMQNDSFDPSDSVDFWDITNRQDWAICENVQRGMNSMTFEHGYYAPMEDMSLDIREYVFARMPDLSDDTSA